MTDQGNLLSLLQAQLSGQSLARPFYTDPEVYQADLENIWYRQWIFAAPLAELPNAGSYVTLQLGSYPVLVVRGGDGAVRAFHNTCSHRGSRICPKESGRATRLVCPYHRWTYDTDGRLLWARDMGPGFDLSAHGLKPIHCAAAGGMVYVCVARDAPDIAGLQTAADLYAAPHRPDELKLAHQSRIIERGNWKLVMENNRECYHCAGSHPGLCRTFLDDPDLFGSADSEGSALGAAHVARCEAAGLPSRFLAHEDELWRLVRIPLIGDSVSYTMDGKAAAPLLPGIPFADAGTLLFYHYPNTWNHYLSDHVLNFRVLPVSATETEVTTSWLVHKDAVEGRDYDLARLTEVWLATNDEDRRVVQENQLGINSPAYRPGPYSVRQESGVIQFVDWYVRSMLRAGSGQARVAAE